MTLLPCPKCHDGLIRPVNRARKAGGAIGTVAGAATGAVGVLKGMKTASDSTGADLGSTAAVLAVVAGAVIGALIGGTTGCEVGARLGQAVDTHVLNNYRCLTCGFTFSTAGNATSVKPNVPHAFAPAAGETLWPDDLE